MAHGNGAPAWGAGVFADRFTGGRARTRTGTAGRFPPPYEYEYEFEFEYEYEYEHICNQLLSAVCAA